MCEKDCNCYLQSDDYKAYKAIEEEVGKIPADQAWALYVVSAGVVREDIATAVMIHIANGNKELVSYFPEYGDLYKPK